QSATSMARAASRSSAATRRPACCSPAPTRAATAGHWRGDPEIHPSEWKKDDSTVERALLVLGVGILDGRLPNRAQQPGKLNLRLPRFSFDELDQKYPFVAIVEEEPHLGSVLRSGLDDARPLDASCGNLALNHVQK